MSDSIPAQRRVLSGMRPTGKLHLGNYMGALHNWVQLQHHYECFFFIADWHALTTDYADPSQIKQNTVDVALDFLAAGLDPEKCTIFVQSHVKQHAELHLLLSMLTPLGWLERVPTYKDQLENLRGKDLATYGFLGYPLLQSADILLYRPQFVPVGQDQVSHVEITREVARRFNSLYKTPVFPEPEALLTPTPKLPGIDGRKMSKSYNNTIGLSEPPARITDKMQSMSTNGQRVQQSDPGDPDLCPVGDLHKVFSSADRIEYTQTGCRNASLPCVWCKVQASESITAITEPIYARRMELEHNIDRTWEMLLEQADKASIVAEETLLPVRAALNITRDLGSARRSFGFSPADKEKLRDLSTYSDLWTMPADQRSKQLREYWHKNIRPYDVPLSQEANRKFHSIQRELEEPFLTKKNKRALVAAPALSQKQRWTYTVPLKTYEIWVLLLWNPDSRVIEDFIVPQKYFSKPLADLKTRAAQYSEGYPVTIESIDNRYTLRIGPDTEPSDITELRRNYKPLN